MNNAGVKYNAVSLTVQLCTMYQHSNSTFIIYIRAEILQLNYTVVDDNLRLRNVE